MYQPNAVDIAAFLPTYYRLFANLLPPFCQPITAFLPTYSDLPH